MSGRLYHLHGKIRSLQLVQKRYEAHLSTNSVAGSENLRGEVISLYKNLIYLSREWPTDLRPQIRSAFLKNKDVKDNEEIRKLIARGEYVSREIIATYHLKKYRAMKRRYYSEDENKHLQELYKSFM